MRWRRAPFLNLLMPVFLLLQIYLAQLVWVIEVVFPKLSIMLYPIGNLMQGGRFKPAWPPLSIAPPNNQPCVLQHFAMFADGWQAHVEWASQLSHGCFACSQSHRIARRVRSARAENVVLRGQAFR